MEHSKNWGLLFFRRFLQLKRAFLFFVSSLSPLGAFLQNLRHAIQSGGALAARGAHPALLCDEGAGQRFFASFENLDDDEKTIEPMSRRRRPRRLSSSALEEEGRFFAL